MSETLHTILGADKSATLVPKLKVAHGLYCGLTRGFYTLLRDLMAPTVSDAKIYNYTYSQSR